MYGGTYRALTKVFTRFGIDVDFVDTTNIENVKDYIKPETGLSTGNANNWVGDNLENVLLSACLYEAMCEFIKTNSPFFVIKWTI